MTAKTLTHTGTVENHNYGNPRKWQTRLRETANYWVDEHGTKYRKRDGRPAGADIWTQTSLNLTTIKPANGASA